MSSWFTNHNFQQFDWNETIISLLLSSFYWGYFFLQLPGGILAEKYGPKLVMTFSMMACSLLGLLIPVAALIGDWIGVYIMKLLQGIFQVGTCFLQWTLFGVKILLDFFQGTFIPAVYVFTSRWIPPKEKSRLFTPAFGGKYDFLIRLWIRIYSFFRALSFDMHREIITYRNAIGCCNRNANYRNFMC